MNTQEDVTYLPIFQKPLSGIMSKLRAMLQFQFFPDAVAVRFDRLDTQVQSLGNLCGLDTLADGTKDIQLAVG